MLLPDGRKASSSRPQPRRETDLRCCRDGDGCYAKTQSRSIDAVTLRGAPTDGNDDPHPTGLRVWIATGHTDMGRGMDSLGLPLQEAFQAFKRNRRGPVRVPSQKRSFNHPSATREVRLLARRKFPGRQEDEYAQLAVVHRTRALETHAVQISALLPQQRDWVRQGSGTPAHSHQRGGASM